MNHIPLRILIVDDEADIYFLFDQYFKKEIDSKKLEFNYVRSAEEAIELLYHKTIPHLALILSDINLPGMNGLELLKYLKQKYPEIRVFMITAYGNAQNSQLALELGAEEIISKPIPFAYLKQLILDYSKSV